MTAPMPLPKVIAPDSLKVFLTAVELTIARPSTTDSGAVMITDLLEKKTPTEKLLPPRTSASQLLPPEVMTEGLLVPERKTEGVSLRRVMMPETIEESRSDLSMTIAEMPAEGENQRSARRSVRQLGRIAATTEGVLRLHAMNPRRREADEIRLSVRTPKTPAQGASLHRARIGASKLGRTAPTTEGEILRLEMTPEIIGRRLLRVIIVDLLEGDVSRFRAKTPETTVTALISVTTQRTAETGVSRQAAGSTSVVDDDVLIRMSTILTRRTRDRTLRKAKSSSVDQRQALVSRQLR